MAAAILESWLSKLVAAVTAATAADTWATETMACAWARSARAFSFLPCLAVSLCWKYHLVTELEWRWQLMEPLPVASSCRAEMVWIVITTKEKKKRRKQEISYMLLVRNLMMTESCGDGEELVGGGLRRLRYGG